MIKSQPTPGEMAKAALDREQAAAAVAQCALRPVGPAGVSVPLKVETAAHGMANLVDVKSGRVMGQCSSEEVANRTRDFLQ